MMRRSMDVIITVVIICSFMLTLQHSILAQDKSKQKIQGKMQKTKEIKSDKGDQTERKIRTKVAIKSEKRDISGEERYRAIIKSNLFMPLGSGDEIKREEFILTGILGRSAFIQMEDSDKSFYVTEGESFGNDVKLVRVGENSITIFHEGSEKELELASSAFISQGGGAKGGKGKQQQGNFGKNSKGMKAANRTGKDGSSGAQKGGWDGGEKKGGDNDWARNMSIDDLSKARGDIERHIEGLRAKGVTDPNEYEGAFRKLETVESAIAEKEGSR